MVYLVVNIIKLSHKTLNTTVNDHRGDRMMLYRSRIGVDLDQISDTCNLGLGNATVPTAESGDMDRCWDETKIDFPKSRNLDFTPEPTSTLRVP